MSILKWCRTYSVHNKAIDIQHKKLFDIFNELYDSFVQQKDTAAYDSIVDELISYASYNFSAEEQYMKEVNYNNKDNHTEEHVKFKEMVTHLRGVDASNKYELSKELIVFLSNWMLHHVIEEDSKIGGKQSALSH
jgi:hemerythrin